MKTQIFAILSLVLLSGCTSDNEINPQDKALKEFQSFQSIVADKEAEYEAAKKASDAAYLSLQESIVDMDDAKQKLYSIIN